VTFATTSKTARGHAAARPTAAQLAVLPTKLTQPWRRPGIIERTRLMAALGQADTPMVALVAPAGYGKSTAAAQFGEATGRRVAWLSADERDDDMATLLRGIAAAVDRVAPLAPDVIGQVLAPGPSVWTSAVPRLGAALAAATDVTLVIDDVDRISDRRSVDVLLTLADHLDGTARLVLTGRTLGEVPVGRLVARQRLTAYGREALAFDDREASAVLAASGVRASANEVRGLNDRTEGWAAGIYLSAMTRGATADGASSVSPMAPERLVEEYLRMEVVRAMDPIDAARLRRWSVLDQLSGPLCDAVLGATDSGSALDRMERTNLFLIPLDRERTWFRLHHLLSDVLRAELLRTEPEVASLVRRRAAAWYAEHDQPETALEYAMAAEDVDAAAALVQKIGQSVMNAGRTDTVYRWFDWFDARSAGTDRPRLAAMAVLAFASDGDSERAEHWAEIADRAVAPVDDREIGLLAISRAVLMRSGVTGLVDDAELAARTVPDDDPWRVLVLAVLGIGAALSGDAKRAGTHLDAAIDRWDRGSVANAAVCAALVQSAVLAIERGDRATAEGHARKARGVLIANGMTEQGVAAAVDALDARLAMSHHAVDQARRDLAHAQRIRPRLGGIPWLAVRARLDLIRAHIAMGDGGGARTLMAEVREITTVRSDLGTLMDEQAELEQRLRDLRGGTAGASTLTIAELRLLPLLTTHLTFREIGERLFVSQNTVKTQAISIYRKLDATSRGQAIARAVAIGLLEAPGQEGRFIPAG
jgi:LuxR family maltose regulon positive regulatory protein